jgi:hypothetical protein
MDAGGGPGICPPPYNFGEKNNEGNVPNINTKIILNIHLDNKKSLTTASKNSALIFSTRFL